MDNGLQSQTLDAILIPGGGLKDDGTVQPWVQERLDEAIRHEKSAHYLMTLSRGTAHKPPVVAGGRKIYEADAGADYLIQNGISAERVARETDSLDLLGNAFCARDYCNFKQWKNLLVITSEISIDRAELTFNWVFNLEPDNNYRLSFLAVPNNGLNSDELSARRLHESNSTDNLIGLMGRIKSLDQLREYMKSEEYTQGAAIRPPSPSARRSY